MTDKPQVKISLDLDVEIVSQIDKIAEDEGTSRSAIIRRAIRMLLFSMPSVPTSEKSPQMQPITHD